MKKTILALMLAASPFLVQSAQAADFFDGNKAKEISRLSLIEPATTAAGYPIYPGDGDWRFISAKVTGPNTRGGYIGRAQLIHPDAGKYFAEMTLDVNLNQIPGIFYTGDACGGDSLVKRSRPRPLSSEGTTSDCLKIVPYVATISGRQITTLLITVSQQNGSRVYDMRMLLNVETFGFPGTFMADWQQDEIARRPDRAKFIEIVGEWAKKMQDATFKAIDYSKPRDAFTTVPSFRQLREAVAGTSALTSGRSVQSTPAPQAQPGSTGTGSGTAEKRLIEAKSLFDRGLMSKEEFDQKRKEILNSF